MELQNLKNSINNAETIFLKIKEEWQNKKHELEMLSVYIEDNEKSLSKLQKNNKTAEESKEVINKIILATRNEAIEFIENIVNYALLDVFQNPDLKIKLQLNTEGAKTSISTFIEEKGELYDIESGRGGGLRDLVSTAILICCRSLVRPKIELPLLLDESLKFLHSTKDNAFKTNAYKFLRDVANKLNMQIILITGEEDKEAINNADNVLFIAKKNNESYLENF
jgi:hypothetical protein